MSLRVYSDKEKTILLCDQGSVGRKCSLSAGSQFVVEVVASDPPPNGYAAFRVVLQYDGDINLIQQPDLGESKAPKCNLGSEQKSPGLYVLTCKVVEPGTSDLSTHRGPLANVQFGCKVGSGQIDLVGGPAVGSVYVQPGFVGSVVIPVKSQPKGPKLVADSISVNCSDQEVVRLATHDTDGDGCSTVREAGLDEMRGGQRDFANLWDFYDVSGAAGENDQFVDFVNDALGVILHYSPLGTEPE